ncbi:MAG: hypothetical protein ACI9MR_004910 [Myxococcota bacterium]|jgi:hypothetical protein
MAIPSLSTNMWRAPTATPNKQQAERHQRRIASGWRLAALAIATTGCRVAVLGGRRRIVGCRVYAVTRASRVSVVRYGRILGLDNLGVTWLGGLCIVWLGGVRLAHVVVFDRIA